MKFNFKKTMAGLYNRTQESLAKMNKKRMASLVMIGLVCLSGCFADSSEAFDSLKMVFGTVYAFFTSTYMFIICTIGLIIIGVQMITNRGEPVVMKKLVPWLCATILIGSASAICKLFFSPDTDVAGLTDGTYLLDGWN